MHPVYLCKVLLADMLARSKKSVIVVTSSGLGNRPFPNVLTYSAAKSCASYLGQALSYELEGRIDVVSWECGETSTKMLKRKAGGRIVTTEVAVDGMLRDLGKERMTWGYFRHDMQHGLSFMVP